MTTIAICNDVVRLAVLRLDEMLAENCRQHASWNSNNAGVALSAAFGLAPDIAARIIVLWQKRLRHMSDSKNDNTVDFTYLEATVEQRIAGITTELVTEVLQE